GWEDATLSQIIDAHDHYKGFGETGEFTLARREGDSIVFLLSHRHYDLENPKPVPFDSKLAEPMRRALLGVSGTVVGFDYRGEVVLAAHEPVSGINYGIVTKIDLAEIRAPFVRAGIIAAGLAIFVVFSGAVSFLRISNPIIKRLEKHTAELAKANEQLKQEIDERKRAEAQIIQAKQEWERTFDVVPDLIMILDNEYRIVQVNKAMADRLGCTPKDLVGQICYDAFHGTKEPVALCPHARLMADGLAHSAEVHEDRLGGDFLVSVNPLHDPDGKLAGSVHVARDITERKQAEDALRESEKRYRDLYENAPNAYFSISAVDGSVLRCNSAALQLLGYDKETITKMKVLDLYADTPHGISKAKEILKRFQAGESIRDVELQMKRKDGQPIWISLTVEPLKDRDGNVIESRSMVINISERKQTEEALQEAHDELEHKVEERTAELK
ncbi:MAG: PAS domain S-box protein, partial [Anaerolineales bacterium]|nr:PAS domain S-box protein [Anaerolineales bacterium]